MAAAIDEKKQSGPSKPLKPNKKKAEPVKRTLNLMIRERQSPEPSKWIPGVLVVLLLAAVFGKFAVMDRFDRLNEAEADLLSLKNEVESMRQAMTDYNEVRDNYNKYNFNGYDKTIPDRLDVLELLEREVFPVCQINNLSITGRTLSMSLSGLSLNQVSALITSLKADPLVESVMVSTTGYSADSDDIAGTANMTVTLSDATTLGGAEE